MPKDKAEEGSTDTDRAVASNEAVASIEVNRFRHELFRMGYGTVEHIQERLDEVSMAKIKEHYGLL